MNGIDILEEQRDEFERRRANAIDDKKVLEKQVELNDNLIKGYERCIAECQKAIDILRDHEAGVHNIVNAFGETVMTINKSKEEN